MPGAMAPPSKAPSAAIHDIEGRGRAEIDDDQVARIDQMRADGVDQTVGARLARAWSRSDRPSCPAVHCRPITSGSTLER